MCEQGDDKEARHMSGKIPLNLAALEGHLPVVQYLCEQGADKEVRGTYGWTPVRRQHTKFTSLWCSTSKG